MKISSTIKLRCKNCFFVKRKNTLFIYCLILKHKQRQG